MGDSEENGGTTNFSVSHNDFLFEKMSVFDGTNSDEWILKVERYFSFHQFKNEDKIEVVVNCFKGDALLWY